MTFQATGKSKVIESTPLPDALFSDIPGTSRCRLEVALGKQSCTMLKQIFLPEEFRRRLTSEQMLSYDFLASSMWVGNRHVRQPMDPFTSFLAWLASLSCLTCLSVSNVATRVDRVANSCDHPQGLKSFF